MNTGAADTTSILGTDGVIFIGIYLLSLILVGVAGRLARKENSLADFYLAGRGMSLFVLLMTLYATQYSGNTLIGFSGKAYRQGYQFLVSVTFMMAVIGCYLLYAPRLYRLSRKKHFITPGDYLQDRFGSTVLTVLATVLFIVGLGNYILSNLKAIGFVVESSMGDHILTVFRDWGLIGRLKDLGLIEASSNGKGVPFAFGIIALSLIMVIYETLGGMRSVAWTDMIQGILLLLGCVCIFGAIEYEYGGLSMAAKTFMASGSDFWSPPTWEEKRHWMSTLVLISFGIAIYPHAIQRIYAAKNEKTLRRSFQIMVFLPIVTTLFMVVVGIVGAARFPGLDKSGSESITLLLLKDISVHIPSIHLLLVLFLAAAMAAIMSTVDSALLSISSLVTQDFYRRFRPGADQAKLARFGKIFSWLVMAFMAFLAIKLPQTIWRLIVIKLELLCQVVPAIFLGLHYKSLRAPAILGGLVVGSGITVGWMVLSKFGMALIGQEVPSAFWGVHAGVWGLLANLIVVGAITFLNRPANHST